MHAAVRRIAALCMHTCPRCAARPACAGALSRVSLMDAPPRAIRHSVLPWCRRDLIRSWIASGQARQLSSRCAICIAPGTSICAQPRGSAGLRALLALGVCNLRHLRNLCALQRECRSTLAAATPPLASVWLVQTRQSKRRAGGTTVVPPEKKLYLLFIRHV